MSCYFMDFRIGPSVVGLVRLTDRGIAEPTDWTYLPYAVTRVRGDGRTIGDGFPSATWTWEEMSQEQLDRLLGLFTTDTDASVAIYIRTPTERGPKAREANFSAVMHRPTFSEGKGAIPSSGYPVWATATVRFTQMVAQ